MEFTYTKGPNHGEIVKHWPNSLQTTETYRNRNGAVQYWSKVTSCWRDVGGLMRPDQSRTILNVIARLWPDESEKTNTTVSPQGRYKPGVPTQINSMNNVEPFGKFRWVPAGEGCVRTLEDGVKFHRVRRHNSGLAWQRAERSVHGRPWEVDALGNLGPWPNDAQAALDHFWPLTKSEAPKDEPVAWQFKTTPDKVDIARCLREAYDAGAREVTINKDGEADETYLHLSVQPVVERFLGSIRGDSLHVTVGIQDWVTYGRPLLAAARAWDAEQKAKTETKIVVKVKGVR